VSPIVSLASSVPPPPADGAAEFPEPPSAEITPAVPRTAATRDALSPTTVRQPSNHAQLAALREDAEERDSWTPPEPELATAAQSAVTPKAETPQPAPSSSPVASLHQAVRASVQASTEQGVFILRILANGEAAAEGCHEALVVLTNSGADLFAE